MNVLRTLKSRRVLSIFVVLILIVSLFVGMMPNINAAATEQDPSEGALVESQQGAPVKPDPQGLADEQILQGLPEEPDQPEESEPTSTSGGGTLGLLDTTTGNIFGGGSYSVNVTLKDTNGDPLTPPLDSSNMPTGGNVKIIFELVPTTSYIDPKRSVLYTDYIDEQNGLSSGKDEIKIMVAKDFFNGATPLLPNATIPNSGGLYAFTDLNGVAFTNLDGVASGDFIVFSLRVNSSDAIKNFLVNDTFSAAQIQLSGKINVNHGSNNNLVVITDNNNVTGDTTAYPAIENPENDGPVSVRKRLSAVYRQMSDGKYYRIFANNATGTLRPAPLNAGDIVLYDILVREDTTDGGGTSNKKGATISTITDTLPAGLKLWQSDMDLIDAWDAKNATNSSGTTYIPLDSPSKPRPDIPEDLIPYGGGHSTLTNPGSGSSRYKYYHLRYMGGHISSNDLLAANDSVAAFTPSATPKWIGSGSTYTYTLATPYVLPANSSTVYGVRIAATVIDPAQSLENSVQVNTPGGGGGSGGTGPIAPDTTKDYYDYALVFASKATYTDLGASQPGGASANANQPGENTSAALPVSVGGYLSFWLSLNKQGNKIAENVTYRLYVPQGFEMVPPSNFPPTPPSVIDGAGNYQNWASYLVTDSTSNPPSGGVWNGDGTWDLSSSGLSTKVRVYERTVGTLTSASIGWQNAGQILLKVMEPSGLTVPGPQSTYKGFEKADYFISTEIVSFKPQGTDKMVDYDSVPDYDAENDMFDTNWSAPGSWFDLPGYERAGRADLHRSNGNTDVGQHKNYNATYNSSTGMGGDEDDFDFVSVYKIVPYTTIDNGMDPFKKLIVNGKSKSSIADKLDDAWTYFNWWNDDNATRFNEYFTTDGNGVLSGSGKQFVAYRLNVNYNPSDGIQLHNNNDSGRASSTVTEIIPKGMKLMLRDGSAAGTGVAGISISRFSGDARSVDSTTGLFIDSTGTRNDLQGTAFTHNTVTYSLAKSYGDKVDLSDFGVNVHYDPTATADSNGTITFEFASAPPAKTGSFYTENNVAYTITILLEIDQDELSQLGFISGDSFTIDNNATMNYTDAIGEHDEYGDISVEWFSSSGAEVFSKRNWDYSLGAYVDSPTVVIPGESNGSVIYPTIDTNGAFDVKYAIRSVGIGALTVGGRSEFPDENTSGGVLVDGTVNPPDADAVAPYFTIGQSSTTPISSADWKWTLMHPASAPYEFILLPSQDYGMNGQTTLYNFHYAMRYGAGTGTWQWGSVLRNKAGNEVQNLIPLKFDMNKVGAGGVAEPLEGWEFELYYADSSGKADTSNPVIDELTGNPVVITNDSTPGNYGGNTSYILPGGATENVDGEHTENLVLVETVTPVGYDHNLNKEFPLTYIMTGSKATLTTAPDSGLSIKDGGPGYTVKQPGDLNITVANKAKMNINISVEVDKDTIKRTSAALGGVPNSDGYNNVGDPQENYRTDINFHSTSNVDVDEFIVEDPLESVRDGYVRIEGLWTPAVWGDIDGRYNIWYKTKNGTGTSEQMPGSPITTIVPPVYPTDPADGWKLWKTIDQGSLNGKPWNWATDYIERQPLGLPAGLAKDDYITAIRFEFGPVKVGFTSKNYGDEIGAGPDAQPMNKGLDGKDNGIRNTNGSQEYIKSGTIAALGAPVRSLSLPEQAINALSTLFTGEPIIALAQPSTAAADIPAKGTKNDWSPDPSRSDYSKELDAFTGTNSTKMTSPLKPASYLLSALQPMQSTDIVSSVSARIALDGAINGLFDQDQDAVLTREIVTFTAGTVQNPAGSVTEENSFVQNMRKSGFEYKNGKWYNRDGSLARTSDVFGLGAWIVVAAMMLVCLALLFRTSVASKSRRKKNILKEVKKMSAFLPVMVLGLALAFPVVASAAPTGDLPSTQMEMEYRYIDGETPDVPATIDIGGVTYRLVSQTQPVLESSMPSTRVYSWRVNGALTPEQLGMVKGLGNIELTPVNVVMEREVDKEITILMETNDVDDVPEFMNFVVSSGTDASGRETRSLKRAGVTFEIASDGTGVNIGLPGGYNATVLYRGVETFAEVGYYTASATFRTSEAESGDAESYIITAIYETDLPPVVPAIVEEPPAPPVELEEVVTSVAATDMEIVAEQGSNLFRNLADGLVPLSNVMTQGVWSILSAIMSIAAVAIAAVTFIGMLMRRRQEKILDKQGVYNCEKDATKRTRGMLMRIVTAIAGLFTMLTWLVIDDFSFGVTWLSISTVPVAIVLVLTIAFVLMTRAHEHKQIEADVYENDGEAQPYVPSMQ